MDPRSGTLRHVDIIRRALLHCIDTSLGRHCHRQVRDHPTIAYVVVSFFKLILMGGRGECLVRHYVLVKCNGRETGLVFERSIFCSFSVSHKWSNYVKFYFTLLPFLNEIARRRQRVILRLVFVGFKKKGKSPSCSLRNCGTHIHTHTHEIGASKWNIVADRPSNNTLGRAEQSRAGCAPRHRWGAQKQLSVWDEENITKRFRDTRQQQKDHIFTFSKQKKGRKM